MRKTITIIAVIAVLAIAAAVVSAQGKPSNKVPADVAAAIEAGLVCPNVDTTRDNWGNATSIRDDGTVRVSGRWVSGFCDVSVQSIVDAACRPGQVNTSRNNWGNASHVRPDGTLVVSGLAVSGRCVIPAGPTADAVQMLIKKFK